MTEEALYEALRAAQKRVTELEQMIHDGQQPKTQAALDSTFFETCLDGIPDMVMLMDNTGQFTHVNAAFLEKSDMQKADVIGRTFEEIAPSSAGMIQKRLLTSTAALR